MQTQSIVRASAQAVTIHTLTEGDLYKRLVESTWASGDDRFRAVIGVVQSVDFNGEDGMISALEVSDGKVAHRVFGTGSDLKMFAVTKDEAVRLILDQRETLERAVRTADQALAEKQRELSHFNTIVDSLPSLTEAASGPPQIEPPDDDGQGEHPVGGGESEGDL